MKIYRLLIAFFALIFFFFLTSNGQKSVRVKIKLIDSTSRLINGYIFEISITNISFDEYPIQDTSIIKKMSSFPSRNFAVPYLEMRENGKYKQINLFKGSGHTALDPCLDTCCNCLILERKKSVKFRMKILECCDWKPGFYRMKVGLRPPLMYDGSIELFKMQFSNYVYFTVGKDQIDPSNH